MSTIRPGSRACLVVVDVQVGVMAECWDAPRVVENLARAVERARRHGVPVVWVQHEGDDLRRDWPAWQLVPELVPADGDKRVYKRFASSFEETELEQAFAEAGTTHVVLAGAQSNWCIRATAYAALERGYDLTLVKDAHTTASIDLADGSRAEASGIVADLNLTMKWLTYPGRSNGTASAEEVFAVADTGADPAHR
jgi:nicotinamidase-related amidase